MPQLLHSVPSANRGGSACSTSGRTAVNCMHAFTSQPRAGVRRQVPRHTASFAVVNTKLRSRLIASAADRSKDTIVSQLRNEAVSTSHNSLWSRLDWELLLLVCSVPAGPALAAEGVKYNASQGEGLVKTLSGVAYIGLLLYFLTRVLNRRARKAREERLAGQGPVRTVFTQLIEKMTEGKDRPQVTPLNAFIGAAQAGLIAYGLFIFSTKVTDLIQGQDLPTGYTAQNIAITVRTIIIGLLYLITFIFSANALGLSALTVQLLIFPDSVVDDEPSATRTPKGPQLPKVSVTSSTDEIRRAFESVSQVPKPTAAATNGSESTSSSSNSSTTVPAAGAGASIDSQ